MSISQKVTSLLSICMLNLSVHVKWKALSLVKNFLYISKICGVTVRAETLSMVPEESHHGCGWRTQGYNEVRVRINQALMIADTICKEGVSRHLKENKFWWKGLSSVLPLPHFSFKDQPPWLGTLYPTGSPWGNQGCSVVQFRASPACSLYSPCCSSILFLFIKFYLPCVPFYQCAFHCCVIWNYNLIIIVNRILVFKMESLS